MSFFLRGFRHFRLALWGAFAHDALSIAKGAAYSSMMTVFPGLLAFAGLLAKERQLTRYTQEISYALGVILPPGSAQLAQRYFDARSNRPMHIILSSGAVGIFAATGVIISWMEGFRCAYGIEGNPWNIVKERIIAILLVPSALVPMFFATSLVAFGTQIEDWISARIAYELRPAISIVWTATEWIIALTTSVLVLALVYHFAIPHTRPFQRVLPGAGLATALWFPVTLVFGWYVTHYANYAVIYGSLGAAIALLVWLYIISLVVLLGAEFNATIYGPKGKQLPTKSFY
ncbi:MAG: YihY/virulence factor BrkB family protein [Acidobacteriaceae bacterium]